MNKIKQEADSMLKNLFKLVFSEEKLKIEIDKKIKDLHDLNDEEKLIAYLTANAVGGFCFFLIIIFLQEGFVSWFFAITSIPLVFLFLNSFVKLFLSINPKVKDKDRQEIMKKYGKDVWCNAFIEGRFVYNMNFSSNQYLKKEQLSVFLNFIKKNMNEKEIYKVLKNNNCKNLTNPRSIYVLLLTIKRDDYAMRIKNPQKNELNPNEIINVLDNLEEINDKQKESEYEHI